MTVIFFILKQLVVLFCFGVSIFVTCVRVRACVVKYCSELFRKKTFGKL